MNGKGYILEWLNPTHLLQALIEQKHEIFGRTVMKALYCLMLLPMTVFSACTTGSEPKVEKVGDELQQTQLEVERAQAELAQSVVKKMDEDRAIQLAARHLALKQVRWGKPVSVAEDDERFYVTYQTPKQELRLIGARVLIVDKDSRIVTAQKRR